MNKVNIIIILLICSQFLNTGEVNAGEVNVYSARKEALIKPILDKFTEDTGIEVNLITGKADTFIKRIEVEGKNSPADLLLTVDAARLVRAKDKGLFQATNSKILNKAIPVHLRYIDNQWYGLSLRSRVIVYNPNKVRANELINYIDLASKKWKSRICVRSSSNIYNQSLVASIISHHGIEQAEIWASGLVGNFARAPKGGDRDQIKAVAVGVCDVAIVNNYYLAGMLDSSQEKEITAAKKVKLFWPDQRGNGAHVNISGAGVLTHAKNKDEAILLLEYLVSDKAQRWYSDINYEYPVITNVYDHSVLKEWGIFKMDNLALSLLGKYNTDAVKLMDRIGWK